MWKIAVKDLKLMVADKKGMMLSFLLPIALISLFALAFGGMGGDDEPSVVELAVVDLDQSSLSRQLTAKIDSMDEVEVFSSTLDSAERLIRKGKQYAALILHPGLEDSASAGSRPLVDLLYDPAREIEVSMLNGILTPALLKLTGIQGMEKRALERFDQQNPQMDSVMRALVHAQIRSQFRDEGPQMDQSYVRTVPVLREKQNSPGLIQAVAGTAIMMLLFSVTAIGAGMIEEKQEGTLRRLLSSPIRPVHILGGKMIAANIISTGQLIVMFLFAALAFGLKITDVIPALVLMIIVTAFACSSFGIFLAATAKSRQQVQNLSSLIILVMSAIGGSMVPLFVMPAWMQKVAVISVNYWGIQGFYDIFWRKLAISDPVFLTKIAVLAGIGIVLSLISVRLFKRNVLKM